MNIMLSCCAGMSTSMLVEKMKEAAASQGKDYTIWACPIESISRDIDKCDVILLGPQVRMEKSNVEKIAKGKPVDVIKPMDYGRLNGAAVVAFAESLLKG